MDFSQVIARNAAKVRKHRGAVGSHKALCDRRRTLLLEQLEPRRLLSGVQQVFPIAHRRFFAPWRPDGVQ